MATNSQDFVYFVLISPSIPAFGFSTYTSIEGDTKYIVSKIDRDGRDVPRWFKFTRSQRTLRIHKDKHEILEFLREAPECEGSRNSRGITMFREMDNGRDAKIALDAEMTVNEATNKALSLKGSQLVEVANLCGSFETEPNMLLFHTVKFAKANPVKFTEYYDSVKAKNGDGKARAYIRKGLHPDYNVLVQKGKAIYWGSEMLGGNEDDATARLTKDKSLLDALIKNIEG